MPPQDPFPSPIPTGSISEGLDKMAAQGAATVSDWLRRGSDWAAQLEGYDPATLRKQHPVMSGIGQGISEAAAGLVTDPRNAALMGPVGALRPVKAVLGGQMAYGAYKSAEEAWRAHKAGDIEASARLGTAGAVNAIGAGAIGLHAAYSEAPPEGPVSRVEHIPGDPVVPTPITPRRPPAAESSLKPKEFQTLTGQAKALQEMRRPENQPDFTNWKPDEIEEFRRRTAAQEVGEAEPTPAKAPSKESISPSGAPKGPGGPVQEAPRSEVVGTATGAKADTDFFKQAKLNKPDVSLSEQMQEAQRLKDEAKITPLGDRGPGPRVPGVDDPERGSLSLRPTKAVAKVVEANKDGVSGVLNKLFDAIDISPEQQTAQNIMRRAEGERNRWMDQRHKEFEKIAKEHDSDTITDLIAFNNAGEGKPGAAFLSPRDQAVATRFHDIYQNTLRPILQTINPDKFQGAGIENYLGRLFKKGDSQATAEGMILQKGPFEGQKAFTKHRAYEWIDESIAAGAKPITNNPVRMQTLVMSQIVKYISAHKAFDAFKDQGLTKFFKIGGNKIAESADPSLAKEYPPAGWTRIDDSLFKPRYMGSGGLVEAGNYYMHPDAAKVFNNWLKPGLRGDWRYDTARTVADTLNQTQLGFSAFHLSTTSFAGAATSDVALGLQQMFRYGKPIKGLTSIAKGMTMLPSSIDTFHLGHMLEQEYLKPGTHPWMSKYADEMEMVNGGIGSGLVWDNARKLAFQKMWGEGGIMGKGQAVLQKGLPAAAEWSSRWLMRYYVPRIKLGMFAKMAYEASEELQAKGASQDEIQTEIGKIWDSVDNRAGQMRYKNRFWNPILKDLMQVAVRSVGWSGGTLIEGFGGAYDAAKLLLGKGPLTSRTAYALAAPMVAAGVGGVMHYMMTGQTPRKIEDYFYPGPEGHKLTVPTYVGRDVMSYSRDPVGTAVNKLNPMIQEFTQLLKNADFYNVEIRHTGDNPLRQAEQVGKYLVRSNVPISIQSARQAMARGDVGWEAALRGQLGFTPAPAWVGRSKFQNSVYDLAKRNWKAGPRTTEDFNRSREVSSLRAKRANKTLTSKELSDAYKSHVINTDDLHKLLSPEDIGTSSTDREFTGLNIRQQLGTLKDADKNELAHYKPLVKLRELYDLPDDERKILIQDYNKLGK